MLVKIRDYGIGFEDGNKKENHFGLSMMQERGIKEEEDVKVCELFDQYERRGQQKEFERSIERMVLENLEEHRTEETIVGKLVRWFSLTKEQAKMYYDKYARVVV